MLVLSRKVNERIIIGPDIELVVVEMRGNKVKLGFIAPQDVGIYRKELVAPATDGQSPAAGSGEDAGN